MDDLEDGDGRIPTISGRRGSWWQATGGGTIGAPPRFVPVADGAGGSRYAARLSVVRPDGNAWAIVGLTLADGQAYDLSKYAGLAFYAKGRGSVRVQVETLDTTDSGSHGEGIALGPEWEYHVVLFDDVVTMPEWTPEKKVRLARLVAAKRAD